MKTKPPGDTPADAAQAFGQAVGDMLRSVGGIQVPVGAWAQLQTDYLRNVAQLWNAAVGQSPQVAQPPTLKDRRFAHEAWLAHPASAFTAQMYLLNARTLMEMAEKVQADAKTKARLRFAVQQWIDAASPSNYLATNPEALKLALQTQGESLGKGVQQLLQDVRKGHVSQTDEAAFEVGRNVASTEGAVVFENEFFQLIEYKPLTATIHERPMLFVPPCINKYYILDLQPENSLIRYTVENGHRLFVVSWRNPDESMKAATWDDYIEHGR